MCPSTLWGSLLVLWLSKFIPLPDLEKISLHNFLEKVFSQPHHFSPSEILVSYMRSFGIAPQISETLFFVFSLLFAVWAYWFFPVLTILLLSLPLLFYGFFGGWEELGGFFFFLFTVSFSSRIWLFIISFSILIFLLLFQILL